MANIKSEISLFNMNKVTSILSSATLLLDVHGVGWFDGGCFTLAHFLHLTYPEDVVIFHISRTEDIFDHAIVYVKSLDLYFDADGLQTKQILFNKMIKKELVAVKYLQPLTIGPGTLIYKNVLAHMQSF